MIPFLQCKAAENTVKRIADTGANADEDAKRGETIITAAEYSRYKQTADERHNQGENLCVVYFFLKKNCGEQHHKNGGGIHQNGCYSQTGHFNSGKITPVEKYQTDDSGAYKAPAIFQFDTQQRTIAHQDIQGQCSGGGGYANGNHLHLGKAYIAENIKEYTDTAPKSGGQNNINSGFCFHRSPSCGEWI